MTDLVARKSSSVLIAAAWAIVVLPTAWGLNYTIKNALKIFAPPAAVTAPLNSTTPEVSSPDPLAGTQTRSIP